MKSQERDPKWFWLFETKPSKSFTVVALIFGSVKFFSSSCTRADGSSDPDEKIPRGLWYLNDLPTKWIPFPRRADDKVSPS